MLTQDFRTTAAQFHNFEIWVVENIEEFFNGNGVIKEVFEKEYNIPFKDFHKRRSEIKENNLELINTILDHINDKHFLVFTKGDPNHNDLIYMQEAKIMNFGVNIANIELSNVYIIIMDKK